MDGERSMKSKTAQLKTGHEEAKKGHPARSTELGVRSGMSLVSDKATT